MFEFCEKIDRKCAFCSKSNYDPIKEEFGDVIYKFCGASSGCDTRINSFTKCWLKMSKGQRNNFMKNKKEQYEILNIGK